MSSGGHRSPAPYDIYPCTLTFTKATVGARRFAAELKPVAHGGCYPRGALAETEVLLNLPSEIVRRLLRSSRRHHLLQRCAGRTQSEALAFCSQGEAALRDDPITRCHT